MTWLLNARLETGEYTDKYGRTQTKSQLHHFQIENRLIKEMVLADEQVFSKGEGIALEGKLLVPSFKDWHTHLDRSRLTLDWQAGQTCQDSLQPIDFTKEPLSKEQIRAKVWLELNNRVDYIRSFISVDEEIKLTHLTLVKEVLDEFEGQLDYDLVIFSQK